MDRCCAVRGRHRGRRSRRDGTECLEPGTLATLEPIKDWSLTSLRDKLIKMGAKTISHGRYVAFQMAEVAIPRHRFADILRLTAELRLPPDLAVV